MPRQAARAAHAAATGRAVSSHRPPPQQRAVSRATRNLLLGGEGGGTFGPQDGGGGGGGWGFRKWAPKSNSQFCLFLPHADGWFAPPVCVQNDQHVMGIVMRCVCVGVPTDPPPPWGPLRPSQADSGAHGGGGGGWKMGSKVPPPFQPNFLPVSAGGPPQPAARIPLQPRAATPPETL